MNESDFVREIFARIEKEPERSRAALRAKIVRTLRGECPAVVPYHGQRGGYMSLEERAERGRALIAQRRQKENEERYARWQGFRKMLLADLEPELHDHIPIIREGPSLLEYTVRLEPEGFAPLLAKYFFSCGEWRREWWSEYRGRLWAVEQFPDCHTNFWLYADNLDEALAIAQDYYPAHLVLPEEPKTPRRWWQRAADWILLRAGARLFT